MVDYTEGGLVAKRLGILSEALIAGACLGWGLFPSSKNIIS